MEALELYKRRFDGNSDNIYSLSEDLYLGLSIYLAIVGVIGTLANGAILIAFVVTKELRNPFNFVLINMVASEFIIATVGCSMDYLAAFHRGWKTGESACVATGFILTFTGMNSLFTLAALALMRWWLMRGCHLEVASTTSAVLVLSTVWLLAAAIAIPPLVHWWGYYAPETSGLTCAPCWEDPACVSYGWYILILGFLIPLFFIIVSSIAVIVLLKTSTSSSFVSQAKEKRERAVTRTILIMLLAFCIVWSPYAIACLLRVIGIYSEHTDDYAAFSLAFAKSSVCLHPIIYIAMNTQFRKAILGTANVVGERSSRESERDRDSVNANERMKKMSFMTSTTEEHHTKSLETAL